MLLAAATVVIRASAGPQRQRPEHRPSWRPSACGCMPGGCSARSWRPRSSSARRPRSCSRAGAFWALREFITLTPTRPGDHRTLFMVFFVITPLQFVLVGAAKLSALQHHDPGLRLPADPRLDRHGGRLQAVPGTDGEDRGGAIDLRLLPELRPGPFDAGYSSRARGPTRGCCSSSCSWSNSATPCSTPGPRSPAGT